MPRIDYYGIELELQALLEADPSMNGVVVTVEEHGVNHAEQAPLVNIRLDRRDATAAQPIAGGQRTRYAIRFVLLCSQYSLESVEQAARLRDDLIGRVEVVLMKNRRIGGMVHYLTLVGGPFGIEHQDTGWLATGEVVAVADLDASTT